MGNHCCKFIDYIDDGEDYRYPIKKCNHTRSINLQKNQSFQLKTIYEEDDDENEKKSIENCIIEIEDKNDVDLNEKYEIADRPISYDRVSISNDTILYASDNSTEIV
jgi:hypothetical protein